MPSFKVPALIVYFKKITLLTICFQSTLAFSNSALSFEDAKALLFQNNSQYNATVETVRAAEFEISASRGLYFPTATSSLSVSRAFDNSENSYGASISLNQNLFRGFSDLAQNENSKLNLTLSTLDQKIKISELLADLRFVYGTLILNSNNLKLAEAIVRRRADTSRLVELRYNGGRENYGSVLLSKTNLEQAVLDNLQAKQDYQFTQRRLAELLGSANETSFEPKTSFEEIVTEKIAFHNSSLQDLRLRKKLELKQSSLKISKSVFYPQLSLSLSHNRQGTEFFPSQTSHTLLASLSLNLFNGTRDYYNFKQTAALELAARYTLDHEITKLHDDTEQKRAQLQISIAQAKISQNYLKAASIRVDIGRKKYNNGLLSFDELDLIESDLISRERSHIQSQINWLSLHTELEAQFSSQGIDP